MPTPALQLASSMVVAIRSSRQPRRLLIEGSFLHLRDVLQAQRGFLQAALAQGNLAPRPGQQPAMQRGDEPAAGHAGGEVAKGGFGDLASGLYSRVSKMQAGVLYPGYLRAIKTRPRVHGQRCSSLHPTAPPSPASCC